MNTIYKNPIVGSGFIAKNFKKIEKKLIKSKTILYAAGVSDSKINEKKKLTKEFSRIKFYLKNFDNEKKLIYISTFSIFDPLRNKSPYIKNKIKIEKFLKNKNINYLIIRFPEIIGKSKNKKTLINYIHNKIKKGKKFELWKNSLRNIVDIDDAVKISEKIIMTNSFKKTAINLISKYFYSVESIVKILEIRLKKKAKYKYLFFKKIKLSKYKPYYVKNNLKKNLYLKKIIKKYY
jgi:nucleoside-diphosphate-sugar epimerase